MQQTAKLSAFEYAVKRFIEWEQEITFKEENHIGKLKAVKLIFFLSVVNKYEETTLLDEVFTNFRAQPYGHVEYDIFKAFIDKAKFSSLTFTDTRCEIHDKNAFRILRSSLEPRIAISIDKAIEALKKKNRRLITLTPFELVELSRCYYSWAKTYHKAKSENELNATIDKELMKKEDMIFYI